MGKKPIVSANYENVRISLKKHFTLHKMCVTSLLCGPWADLWPFYGLYSLTVTETIGFFPYKSLYFLCYATLPMFADAHYFELGLPVVSLYLIHLIFMCIFSVHIHVYVDFKTVRILAYSSFRNYHLKSSGFSALVP